MTALAVLVGWIAALAAGVAVLALRRPAPAPATAPAPADTFDEHAATACATTRPVSRPLRVDTATGSHDHIPMREDNRRMLADYCEGMWHHTQEMP